MTTTTDRNTCRDYDYATDGGYGTITARDFAEAKAKFDAMFTPELIEDGANGWIADVDGYRYTVGR